MAYREMFSYKKALMTGMDAPGFTRTDVKFRGHIVAATCSSERVVVLCYGYQSGSKMLYTQTSNFGLNFIFVYCKSDDTPHQRTNMQLDKVEQFPRQR